MERKVFRKIETPENKDEKNEVLEIAQKAISDFEENKELFLEYLKKSGVEDPKIKTKEKLSKNIIKKSLLLYIEDNFLSEKHSIKDFEKILEYKKLEIQDQLLPSFLRAYKGVNTDSLESEIPVDRKGLDYGLRVPPVESRPGGQDYASGDVKH